MKHEEALKLYFTCLHWAPLIRQLSISCTAWNSRWLWRPETND